MKEPRIFLGNEQIRLVAEIDDLKGRWEALQTLSPDRLDELRRVASIESVGSSTRIEGSKLTDAQVETHLSRIAIPSFPPQPRGRARCQWTRGRHRVRGRHAVRHSPRDGGAGRVGAQGDRR